MSPPELTTPQLLSLILAAWFVQAFIAAGVAVWRRTPPAQPGPAAARPVEAADRPAWAGTRDFRVTQRQFEDAAQSQCSFHLQPVDGQPLADFKPGQYLTFVLQVPGDAGGGAPRTLTRCYSLSDAPAPDHYRVTIKRVPPPPGRPGLAPGVASQHFHDRVQVGDVVQVKAPAGRFCIDPEPAPAVPAVPVVLVAGGIGITPLLSILQARLKTPLDHDVYLFYGLRQGAEHAFKAELQALAADHPRFKLHVVYSRPAADDVQGRDFQHTGHVDLALLQQTLRQGRHRYWICGPAALMNSLVPALAAWGVPDADVHFEAFGPATVHKAAPAAAASAAAVPGAALEVQFSRTGRTLGWDGLDTNLLDFAERHGIAVESGCRAGRCGSCETRLIAGTVDSAQPPDHDAAPGHCLLCVARPTSALVLEA